jgi:hypothetical protein
MSRSSTRERNVDAHTDRPGDTERTATASFAKISPSQRMLTEREVAELLECSVVTVRRERKRKRIAYHRHSRKRIRYSIDDVRAYQMSGRVNANETSKTTSDGNLAQSRSNPTGNARSVAADRAAAQAILNRRQRS